MFNRSKSLLFEVLADDGDVWIVDDAELAAVAAITYSDLLLGMPRWLGDGLVHHLADEKGRSHG